MSSPQIDTFREPASLPEGNPCCQKVAHPTVRVLPAGNPRCQQVTPVRAHAPQPHGEAPVHVSAVRAPQRPPAGLDACERPLPADGGVTTGRPDHTGVSSSDGETSGRPRVLPSSRLGTVAPATERALPGGGSGAAALLSGWLSSARHATAERASRPRRANPETWPRRRRESRLRRVRATAVTACGRAALTSGESIDPVRPSRAALSRATCRRGSMSSPVVRARRRPPQPCLPSRPRPPCTGRRGKSVFHPTSPLIKESRT